MGILFTIFTVIFLLLAIGSPAAKRVLTMRGKIVYSVFIFLFAMLAITSFAISVL